MLKKVWYLRKLKKELHREAVVQMLTMEKSLWVRELEWMILTGIIKWKLRTLINLRKINQQIEYKSSKVKH